jgi:superoxide dismutase
MSRMNQEILCEIKKRFSSEDLTRKKYREARKSNSRFPSDKKIQKVFGSFTEFKEFLKQNFKKEISKFQEKPVTTISEELKKPEELLKVVEEVQANVDLDLKREIISKLRDFFDRGLINSRDEYRKLRKDKGDLSLPSCDRISKVFGSFSNFKKEMENNSSAPKEEVNISNVVEMRVEIEEIYDDIVEDEEAYDDTPEYTSEEIAEFRRQVEERRKELFSGEKRHYRWQPESRTGMSSFFY